MKHRLPSLKIFTTVLTGVFTVSLLSLSLAMTVAPARVSAETRLEACSKLHGWEVSTCQDNLDRNAWNACVGSDNPGKCAEDYRNAPADQEDPLDGYGDCRSSSTLDESNCGIIKHLNVLIRILAATVGIVITVMIVWGGIQYTISRDNPQQTAAAKAHIQNALLALVVYIFSIALLNWLIPGGILN